MWSSFYSIRDSTMKDHSSVCDGTSLGITLIPVIPPPIGDSSSIQCGGEFFVTEPNWTMITSPGFPNNNEKNLNCVWTLTSNPHFRIALILITVNLEAGNCLLTEAGLLEINDRGRAVSMSRSLVYNTSSVEVQFLILTNSQYQGDGFRVSFSFYELNNLIN
jgi:hypothetical protein